MEQRDRLILAGSAATFLLGLLVPSVARANVAPVLRRDSAPQSRRVSVQRSSPTPIPSRPGRHFIWSEMTASNTASREGIDNTPTPEAARALIYLTTRVLDPLRNALDRPVYVSNAYRSPELNEKIAEPTGQPAAKDSRHVRGEAADIVVSGASNFDLAVLLLRLGVPFDQIIWYDPERSGHLHVSVSATTPNRYEVRRGLAGTTREALDDLAWNAAGISRDAYRSRVTA